VLSATLKPSVYDWNFNPKTDTCYLYVDIDLSLKLKWVYHIVSKRQFYISRIEILGINPSGIFSEMV
jgi:hypothetical protein